MSRHLEQLGQRHPALKECAADIQTAFEMIRDSFRQGGTLLICGNGGSAADAEHWAGELLKGFESKRPLSGEERQGLRPELAQQLQGAMRAIPLTGFLSLRTAYNNDVNPKLEFAQLVWALGRPGDVLVGISTSGNSESVLFAVETARAKGLKTIGLSGLTGGKLRAEADLCLRVPASRTLEVQEYHLPIYHVLCLMLEDEFFGG